MALNIALGMMKRFRNEEVIKVPSADPTKQFHNDGWISIE